MSHLDIWEGRVFQGTNANKAGMYFVYLRNSKETPVIAVGRLVGDEVRKLQKIDLEKNIWLLNFRGVEFQGMKQTPR